MSKPSRLLSFAADEEEEEEVPLVKIKVRQAAVSTSIPTTTSAATDSNNNSTENDSGILKKVKTNHEFVASSSATSSFPVKTGGSATISSQTTIATSATNNSMYSKEALAELRKAQQYRAPEITQANDVMELSGDAAEAFEALTANLQSNAAVPGTEEGDQDLLLQAKMKLLKEKRLEASSQAGRVYTSALGGAVGAAREDDMMYFQPQVKPSSSSSSTPMDVVVEEQEDDWERELLRRGVGTLASNASTTAPMSRDRMKTVNAVKDVVGKVSRQRDDTDIDLQDILQSLQTSIAKVEDQIVQDQRQIERLQQEQQLSVQQEEKLQTQVEDGIQTFNQVEDAEQFLAMFVGMLRDKQEDITSLYQNYITSMVQFATQRQQEKRIEQEDRLIRVKQSNELIGVGHYHAKASFHDFTHAQGHSDSGNEELQVIVEDLQTREQMKHSRILHILDDMQRDQQLQADEEAARQAEEDASMFTDRVTMGLGMASALHPPPRGGEAAPAPMLSEAARAALTHFAFDQYFHATNHLLPHKQTLKDTLHYVDRLDAQLFASNFTLFHSTTLTSLCQLRSGLFEDVAVEMLSTELVLKQFDTLRRLQPDAYVHAYMPLSIVQLLEVYVQVDMVDWLEDLLAALYATSTSSTGGLRKSVLISDREWFVAVDRYATNAPTTAADSNEEEEDDDIVEDGDILRKLCHAVVLPLLRTLISKHVLDFTLLTHCEMLQHILTDLQPYLGTAQQFLSCSSSLLTAWSQQADAWCLAVCKTSPVAEGSAPQSVGKSFMFHGLARATVFIHHLQQASLLSFVEHKDVLVWLWRLWKHKLAAVALKLMKSHDMAGQHLVLDCAQALLRIVLSTSTGEEAGKRWLSHKDWEDVQALRDILHPNHHQQEKGGSGGNAMAAMMAKMMKQRQAAKAADQHVSLNDQVVQGLVDYLQQHV